MSNRRRMFCHWKLGWVIVTSQRSLGTCEVQSITTGRYHRITRRPYP